MQYKLSTFLSVLMILVGVRSVQAQIFKPIKWTFGTEKIADGEYYLIFTAKAEKGWNVYSQFTDDNGPVPTSINYEDATGVKLEGKSIESGHKKEGHDPLFEDAETVIKFLSDQPFVIKQKIKLLDANKKVSGYLTYMTCNDERCLPPSDVDFVFTFDNGKNTTTTTSSNNKIETPHSNTASVQSSVQASPSKPTQEKGNEISTSKPATSVSKPATTITIAENSSEGLKEEKSNLLNPIKWEISKNKISDTEYELIYTANVDKGWSVYSEFTAEGGPIPTSITYESKDGITLLGTAEESGHKKSGPDKMFEGINVIKYLDDQPFIIKQKIKVNDPSKEVKGYLTYMACDNTKCLQPKDVDFNFTFDGYVAPKSEYVSSANIENGEIDQLIPSLYRTFKNPKNDCGGGLSENKGLLWTFIFGFLGGLFALLTPCVFPMIPITVSFFTKDTKRKGWVNGLIYGLSIIAIYVSLGLIITKIFGPEALNRLSTNWIANTLFFIIFIFFAFSFFGFYEITLPSSWSTKSDQMADKGGIIGIFFMAFTLALVSFSCTGPIIGTALVQAAGKGEYLGPFLVMFGFSLALALPFGLFAAFPAWLNSLPRSGSWMNSVKVILGFLELALALKFLSVADMTNHWGVLKYELFMGVWVLVFIGMALYLFGFIKFPHDSPIKKLSTIRKTFGLLAVLATIYLISGFRVSEKTGNYHALSLMSGLAPPAYYNFFLPDPEINQAIKAKYMSYTKCANNIPCFKDYYEGLSYAREVNKPMMIDFTGYGCVNCRKTEEHIWVADKVRNMLTNDIVLVSLYVDDDKKLDNVLISKNSKEKLRNVGKIWGDFQIVNFEQNSQPLYVLVNTDEEVLAAPRPYKDGVDEYFDFLKCGTK